MIICAKCGMIPAKCDCNVPSPLQKLVGDQRNDPKLWFQLGSENEKYLQSAIRQLHKAIEHQRATGAS